jgi:hypothetical protein
VVRLKENYSKGKNFLGEKKKWVMDRVAAAATVTADSYWSGKEEEEKLAHNNTGRETCWTGIYRPPV